MIINISDVPFIEYIFRKTISFVVNKTQLAVFINLLEYPSPAPPTTPSQKSSHGNISGTKRDIIDPLVSKQPEKNLKKKNSKMKKYRKK